MRVETVRRMLGRAEAAVGRLASHTENDPEVQHSQVAMFKVVTRSSPLGFCTVATRVVWSVENRALAMDGSKFEEISLGFRKTAGQKHP